MRFALCFAVLACRNPPPQGPGSEPAVVVDAAPAPAPDATPDAAPAAAMLQLYENGKFFTASSAMATDRDGCIGTPDDLAACKRIDPKSRCDLTPWISAGDVYCRGAAMGPGDMPKPRPPEACACSCGAEYIKAYDAWSKRAQECANVP